MGQVGYTKISLHKKSVVKDKPRGDRFWILVGDGVQDGSGSIKRNQKD